MKGRPLKKKIKIGRCERESAIYQKLQQMHMKYFMVSD